jgi:two-component system response regulator (stage 0 sporulation protein F)
MTTSTKTIILVEDEPDILHLLQRLLQPLIGDYTIVSASDGQTALTYLQNDDVPLLITDYNMPEMNGLLLTSQVKERSPSTKVALITAYHTPQLQRLARLHGVDYYLPKPFSIDELEMLLGRVLQA